LRHSGMILAGIQVVMAEILDPLTKHSGMAPLCLAGE